jgi:lipid-binding SYLF domain-containing protein
MKPLLLSLLFLSLCSPALAIDKSDLNLRLLRLTAKFEEMQSKPEKRIPAETLEKACGIVLLDRTKAGLVFAYQGGAGVAMVKGKDGEWSAPAFMSANEASLGLQIGGQNSFVAILIMNTNTARGLGIPNFEFGGEATGTAGNESDGVKGTVNSTEQSVLVYADTKGLYGGATIKGDSLTPDQEANLAYYGKPVTTSDILFDKKVQPSDAAKELSAKLKKWSAPKKSDQ